MNGLDSDGLQGFRQMLRTLCHEFGTTILLSSHQFAEVDQVATHVGIMNDVGDLLFQGRRDELSTLVPQELVIKVDSCDEALRILGAEGFAVDSEADRLVIRGATADMAREVNRLLVANSVGVHHLTIELTTLEALFVKVTRTVKAWDSR